MPSVHHIVYVSTAHPSLIDRDLEQLLVQARERNKSLGVTGMLIFGGGNFIQALEGEEDAVREVFASICRDTRHFNLIKMLDFANDTRNFARWSMAYAHEPHREKIEGCINTLNDQREALDNLPDDDFIGRMLGHFLVNNP